MNTVTLPKLAPELLPGVQPTPELCLLAAVIEKAVSDLSDDRYRGEATAFFRSKGFEVYCDWLGWDAEQVRQRVFQASQHLECKPTVES